MGGRNPGVLKTLSPEAFLDQSSMYKSSREKPTNTPVPKPKLRRYDRILRFQDAILFSIHTCYCFLNGEHFQLVS